MVALRKISFDETTAGFEKPDTPKGQPRSPSVSVMQPEEAAFVLIASNTNVTPTDVAKSVIEAMNGHRVVQLNMGGGSDPASVSREDLVNKAQCSAISIHAVRSSYSDVKGDVLTADQLNFQLDMLDVAGVMAAEMQEMIHDLSLNAGNLTADQREKFVTIIDNTATLQRVNEGRQAMLSAEIAARAKNTLDLMKELFDADMLPFDLKMMAVGVIGKTAETFPNLNLQGDLDAFIEATNEQAKLDNKIEALKAMLAKMLLGDDLTDEQREEIESVLEELNNREEGQPLERDMTKRLQALSDAMNLDSLTAMIAEIKEQNISVRAEKFDMTTAEINAIDAYMDQLDAIAAQLDNDEIGLKALIAEALLALDADPASIKSMASMQELNDALKASGLLDGANAQLAQDIQIALDQGQFINKISEQTLAVREMMPVTHVQQTVNLYQALAVVRDVAMSLPAAIIDAPRFGSGAGNTPTVTANEAHAPQKNGDGGKPSIDGGNPDNKTILPNENKNTGGSDGGIGNANTDPRKDLVGGANPLGGDGVDNHPTHPIVETIEKLMDKLATAPASLDVAALATKLCNSPQLQNVIDQAKKVKEFSAQKKEKVFDKIKDIKGELDVFKKRTIDVVAKKYGETKEGIQRKVTDVIDDIRLGKVVEQLNRQSDILEKYARKNSVLLEGDYTGDGGDFSVKEYIKQERNKICAICRKCFQSPVKSIKRFLSNGFNKASGSTTDRSNSIRNNRRPENNHG